MPPVRFIVDHNKKRLYRIVDGEAPTREIGKSLIQYYVDHPDQIPYDTINDLRSWSGKFEWDWLREHTIKVEEMLAEHLRKNPETARPGRRIALVVTDKMWKLLARAIQNYVSISELNVFASMEEAEAWLDAPRSHSDRPS